jgi:hypothetical protein
VQFTKTNDAGILIETPTGPRAFSGMSKIWHETVVRLDLENGKQLKVGINHKFLCAAGWATAIELYAGDRLTGQDGGEQLITAIQRLPGEFLYDLLDVDGGAVYIADGVIHHNCEFLSSDSLLINSLRLIELRETPELFTDMGFKFWRAEEELGGAKNTYMVAVDPATGGGGDYSVIEVFEFPSLEQVAEWRSNEINIPLLYAKVKWILNKLSASIPGKGRSEVLWTFERNGIGEAMAALYHNDEKQPEYAELYSDTPGKLGVFTSGKNKVLACLQLKALIEKVTGGLKINSRMLLEELKNFVAKGGTYDHKIGATSDCVMATVIMTRLLKRLSEYNDAAFKHVNEYVEPTDPDDAYGDEPVPMLF